MNSFARAVALFSGFAMLASCNNPGEDSGSEVFNTRVTDSNKIENIANGVTLVRHSEHGVGFNLDLNHNDAYWIRIYEDEEEGILSEEYFGFYQTENERCELLH